MKVQLTLEDIKYMVTESVKRCINERTGYFDNDGTLHVDMEDMVYSFCEETDDADGTQAQALMDQLNGLGIRGEYYLNARRTDYEEDDTNGYEKGEFEITYYDGLDEDLEKISSVSPELASYINDYIEDEDSWDLGEHGGWDDMD